VSALSGVPSSRERASHPRAPTTPTPFHAAPPGYNQNMRPVGASGVTLKISGVVPTFYRGVTYSTPIAILMPAAYPAVPPAVTVVPNEDLSLEPSCPSIERSTGRVIHPCVNGEWRRTSSLAEAILVYLTSAFGDGGVPPLRARPPTQRAYGAQSQQAQSQAYGGFYGQPAPQGQGTAQYPYGGQGQFYGQAPPAGGSGQYYSGQPVGGGGIAYTVPVPGRAGGAGGYPVQGAGAQGGGVGYPPAPRSSASSGEADVRTEMRRAVTGKLRAELSRRYTALGEAAEESRELGDRLAERGTATAAAVEALREREGVLRATLAEARARGEAARAWLEAHEGEGGGNPCPVTPTTVLGAQLLRLVSEDVALEEYVVHVEEALGGRRIGGAEMAAEVRDVARKQFNVRALAIKIDGALGREEAAATEMQRQYSGPSA
jgi:hypothetical protein